MSKITSGSSSAKIDRRSASIGEGDAMYEARDGWRTDAGGLVGVALGRRCDAAPLESREGTRRRHAISAP